MKLFDEVILSDTEIAIVKERLSNPVVIKYLRSLAQNAAIDAVMDNNRLTSEPDDIYKVKNAFLQGTIAAVSDLVDIALTVPQSDSPTQ